MSIFKRLSSLSGLWVLLAVSTGTPLNVFAGHSWNGYHWLKTSTSKVNLSINDNISYSSSGSWVGILQPVIDEWNNTDGKCNDSTLCPTPPLTLTKGNGNNLLNQRKCPPKLGAVEVCNTTYGRNGWLGIASVWVSSSHITQGTVKLNDSYFNTTTYNKPVWKNLVLCQELGHTFGLDHQDENFSNPVLSTCMDYTGTNNNPAANQYPNKHDFDQLITIYGNHNDAASSTSSTTATPGKAPPEVFYDMNEPSQWGRLVRRSRNGRNEVYELHIGGGHRIFTFVIRAE